MGHLHVHRTVKSPGSALSWWLVWRDLQEVDAGCGFQKCGVFKFDDYIDDYIDVIWCYMDVIWCYNMTMGQLWAYTVYIQIHSKSIQYIGDYHMSWEIIRTNQCKWTEGFEHCISGFNYGFWLGLRLAPHKRCGTVKTSP